MKAAFQKGITYIELIVFIVVMGVMMGGLLQGMNYAVIKFPNTKDVSAGSFLAHARMEIIALYRETNGVASLSDPCSLGSPPAICTPLAGFGNYTVSTSFTPTPISSTKTTTVQVQVSKSTTIVSKIEADMQNYEGK